MTASNPIITVFTPSYNRAHTLPALYESLMDQGDKNLYEWLIVDDNSSDGTSDLVQKCQAEDIIDIHYVKLDKNGGKPRAINIACELARSPLLFIVDSDDHLVSGIIPKILEHSQFVLDHDDMNGIGVLRVHPNGECFAKPNFENYVDATDIQRKDYGLNVDCNEAYKISVLRKYPFRVWEGENFTPESTVLDAMALDGYKLRWLNQHGVVAEYLSDGLTKGSWNLLRNNPMGYAMLFNSKLLIHKDFGKRLQLVIRMIAQSLLGKQPSYLKETNAPLLTFFALPLGVVLWLRRLYQYRIIFKAK